MPLKRRSTYIKLNVILFQKSFKLIEDCYKGVFTCYPIFSILIES